MNQDNNNKRPRAENDRHSGNRNENRRTDENDDSNDEFPGYPHYPAKEDIMNPSNDIERVQVDVENLTPTGKYVNPKSQQESNTMSNQPASDTTGSLDDASAEEEELTLTPGTEADVTRDDLLALGGPRFSDNDLQSNARSARVSGDDLDIPGAELDNQNEEIGEEDEENNYYSLGGERHEDLEEDKT